LSTHLYLRTKKLTKSGRGVCGGWKKKHQKKNGMRGTTESERQKPLQTAEKRLPWEVRGKGERHLGEPKLIKSSRIRSPKKNGDYPLINAFRKRSSMPTEAETARNAAASRGRRNLYQINYCEQRHIMQSLNGKGKSRYITISGKGGRTSDNGCATQSREIQKKKQETKFTKKKKKGKTTAAKERQGKISKSTKPLSTKHNWVRISRGGEKKKHHYLICLIQERGRRENTPKEEKREMIVEGELINLVAGWKKEGSLSEGKIRGVGREET